MNWKLESWLVNILCNNFDDGISFMAQITDQRKCIENTIARLKFTAIPTHPPTPEMEIHTNIRVGTIC